MAKSARQRAAQPSTPDPQPVTRAPLTIWLYLAAAWLLGWWMTLDGLHQRLFGDYVRINGQLGPWASLIQEIGVEPQRLGLTFVAFGLALIGASFGVYMRRAWGYSLALAGSSIAVLYLGFGTPVALACLILLLLPSTRRYVRAGAAS